MKIGFHQAEGKNTWASLKPSLKLLYGLSITTLSLVVPHKFFGYFLFLFTPIVLQHFAKIPAQRFFRAYKIPLIFIIISLITIVFEFGTFPQNKELLLTWGEQSGIFVSYEGLSKAFLLSSRVFGSLAGLFTISLTCSLVDILQALKTWHFPTIFLTLMELIYRFSMSLYRKFQNVIIAQDQRLAYDKLSKGIPALGQALGRVFSDLLLKSNRTANALDLRLYQGRLNTLPIHYPDLPEKEREIILNLGFLLLIAGVFTFLI